MAHGIIDSIKEKVESTIHKATRRHSHENEQQAQDAADAGNDSAAQTQGQPGEQMSHEQQGLKDMAQQGQQQASSMGQSAAEQAKSQIPGQAKVQMPRAPNPT
ncbi:hypothetical protein IWW37_005288 [Coemansia sp. RSA 2050]|nr:hypothetical protein IWW37_005288 [Coemansia sp. RSA 2050]KAJ2730421.1 hypothetical protein IW152_005260 [Coemansia sp. BCRC 34962]